MGNKDEKIINQLRGAVEELKEDNDKAFEEWFLKNEVAITDEWMKRNPELMYNGDVIPIEEYPDSVWTLGEELYAKGVIE